MIIVRVTCDHVSVPCEVTYVLGYMQVTCRLRLLVIGLGDSLEMWKEKTIQHTANVLTSNNKREQALSLRNSTLYPTQD